MKRNLFLILIVLSANLVCAQDIIVKQNGDEIKSKIVEITSDNIKYKDFEFQDGPLRNIRVSEVFMIIYENGIRETFSPNANQPPVIQQPPVENQPPVEEQPPVVEQPPVEYQDSNEDSKDEVPLGGYKGNYFMLGVGYGNSYGGYGLRAQMRVGGNQGFGFHAGAGYFPSAPVLAAVGVKYFPYRDIYVNAQFGLTGYETSTYWDSWGYYEYTEQLLYGPSILAGVDMTWGSKVGFGFNAAVGGSYYVNVINWSSFGVALDVGFIMRF